MGKSLEVALTSDFVWQYFTIVDTDISKATCTKCKTTVCRGNDPKKYSKGGDPIDIKMCELALHYLTPPASSVDIERLFSTAADITTNDRNRINFAIFKNNEIYFSSGLIYIFPFNMYYDM